MFRQDPNHQIPKKPGVKNITDSGSPGGRSPSLSGVGPLPLPGVATAPVQPGPGWAQAREKCREVQAVGRWPIFLLWK